MGMIDTASETKCREAVHRKRCFSHFSGGINTMNEDWRYLGKRNSIAKHGHVK